MSPALPVVSARQTIRALAKVGFAEVSRKGSHVKLRNESCRTVIVPDDRELARGTLPSCARRVSQSMSSSICSEQVLRSAWPGVSGIENASVSRFVTAGIGPNAGLPRGMSGGSRTVGGQMKENHGSEPKL